MSAGRQASLWLLPWTMLYPGSSAVGQRSGQIQKNKCPTWLTAASLANQREGSRETVREREPEPASPILQEVSPLFGKHGAAGAFPWEHKCIRPP